MHENGEMKTCDFVLNEVTFLKNINLSSNIVKGSKFFAHIIWKKILNILFGITGGLHISGSKFQN